MVETPDIIQFPTGAKRSGDAERERYDLISPIGLRRLAETYAEGAAKYGDRNWENGFPASVIFNHGLRHLNLWLDGDRSEDHLAHAAWNLFALMHFEELRPDSLTSRHGNDHAIRWNGHDRVAASFLATRHAADEVALLVAELRLASRVNA